MPPAEMPPIDYVRCGSQRRLPRPIGNVLLVVIDVVGDLKQAAPPMATKLEPSIVQGPRSVALRIVP